jgi:spore maturation protein CgeB
MNIYSHYGQDDPLVKYLLRIGNDVTSIPVRHATLPDESVAFFLINLLDAIKRPLYLLRLKRLARKMDAPLVYWNRDAPWNLNIKRYRSWMISRGLSVDIYLAHSMQTAETFGGWQHYFPNAVDTENYHLDGVPLDSLRSDSAYSVDVSFFGSLSNTYRRAKARLEVMAEISPRLRALGISHEWRDTCEGQPAFPLNEQRQFIRKSRINLSVGAMCDTDEPSWGLPERYFGIPACGGFLVSDYRKYASTTFRTHCVQFGSSQELVNLVKHWLQQPTERREVAEAMHREVLEGHTYAHRAATLQQLVTDWKRRKRPA